MRAEVEASPVKAVPLILMVHELAAAFHSGSTVVTVGTVEENVYLQLPAAPHVASSDVFKKTMSFPSRLFAFS